MARDESDREDLLREATALVERIELGPCATGSASAVTDATAEHVVAGFRSGGALSVFFGADPVYQFNSAGQLRRAYCDGLLYKAAGGRLVVLQRVRHDDEVQLLSHDLSDNEQNRFVEGMLERLRQLAGELDTGRFRVIGQAPEDVDVLARVQAWLATHDGLPIANSPRVTHI